MSEDEAVSDEENDEICLVSSHTPLTSSRNPNLSSKVSPSFLGTIVTQIRREDRGYCDARALC